MAENRGGADRPGDPRENLNLAPDPTDVVALCCLAVFVIAALVGGLLLSTAIGLLCLAGSTLVVGLVLSWDGGSATADLDDRVSDIEAHLNAAGRRR